MKKLTLRLSDGLHGALKQLSEHEDRSLHGEIVYHLKRVVESMGRTSVVESMSRTSQAKESADAE